MSTLPPLSPSRTNNSVSTPVAASEKNDLETLANRLRSAEGVSEPGIDLVMRHWQKVIGALVVVVLVYWLVNLARTSQIRAQGDAAMRFSGAQEVFSQIIATENKDEAKDKLRGFEDSLNSLQETGSGSGVYPNLAALYFAAHSAYNGQADVALRQLSSAKTDLFKGLTAPTKSKKLSERAFIDELGTLLALKVQLQKSGSFTPELKTRFTELAYGGQFTNSEAILVLTRFATTEEEKTSVEQLAEKVLQARPGQRQVLTPELERLGVKTAPIPEHVS